MAAPHTSAAPTPAVVEIVHGDRAEPVRYHPHQKLHALLQQVLDAYAIADDDRADYVLVDAAEHQLDGRLSLEDAGVHGGDRLILRCTVIYVVYNGRRRSFSYVASALVQSLLQQALSAFGITTNVHLMSLFDAENHELVDGQTLEQAKVAAGVQLVLRQSTVKGG